MRHVPVARVLCGVVAFLLAAMCGQVAATPPPPPPPLVCRTAEDSAVLVQTACRLDDACRFYFPRGVPVVLLEQRLHIVQARASGGGAAATDVRTFYQPAAWNDGTPLIAYAAAAAEDVGASNCTALAAALNDTVPAPAVRDALYALLVYQTLLADDRICTDVNEIPVWDDASQAYYCACAAGHVCASSTALGGGLTYAAVVLFAVVVVLGALAVTVASACTTRQVLVRLREDAIKRARLRIPLSV